MATNLNIMRSRRRKRLFIFCGVLLVVAVALAVVFFVRRGRDYKGELARLLPADTAAFVAMDHLETIADRLDQTAFMTQLHQIVPISSLLVDDEDLEELGQKGIPLSRAQADALVERFTRRWFGQNVAFALYPIKTSSRPAIVLISRTRAGFEENLAELTASLLPDARTEREEYRGEKMVLFRDDDKDESVSYCRFGRTVALSFLNDSLEPLKILVDRRLDGGMANLTDDEAFQRFRNASPASDGMALFVQCASTFELIEMHGKIDFSKHQRSLGNLIFLRDLLQSHEHVFGHIFLPPESMNLVARFYPQGNMESGEPDKIGQPRIPSLVHGGALVSGSLVSPKLADVVRQFTFGFPEMAEMRQESEEWNERFREDFGLDLAKDVIPALDGEMGGAVFEVVPNLFLPTVKTCMIARVNDPARVRSMLDRAFVHYQSQQQRGESLTWKGIRRVEASSSSDNPSIYIPIDFPGGMFLGVRGNYLGLVSPYEFGEELMGKLLTSASENTSNDIRLRFSMTPETVARTARSVLGVLALWDKDAREDLQDYGPYLDLMKTTGTIEFVMRRNKSKNEFELIVPLH